MMKETKKSLKSYFLVIGVLIPMSLLIGKQGINENINNVETFILIIRVIIFLIALMFFYAGLKMNYYINNNPKILVNLVIIFSVFGIIHGFLTGRSVASLFPIVAAWYLIRNIKKLSLKDSNKNKK
jgi:hypothetical protein